MRRRNGRRCHGTWTNGEPYGAAKRNPPHRREVNVRHAPVTRRMRTIAIGSCYVAAPIAITIVIGVHANVSPVQLVPSSERISS